MKAFGYLSQEIETRKNFDEALQRASQRKKRRKEVKQFKSNEDENLNNLLDLYVNESYEVSPYSFKTIMEKKERFLSMLPFPDHVFHWAMLLPTEYKLDRAYHPNTYASITGRGQHKMVHDISRDIKASKGDLTHYLSIDAAKMYASIPHSLVKGNLRRKIKDPKLLRMFDTIIESAIGTPMGKPGANEPTGVPIGLKISTIIANMSFLYFDHDLRRCFCLSENKAAACFWANEYARQFIGSAKYPEDFEDIAKGEDFLRERFLDYLTKGIRKMYRFMDNVVVLHHDRVFLHVLLDMIGLYMGGEMHMELNAKWNVGALRDGLNIVGYRIFEDGHVRVMRELKAKIVRKIRKGRKLGLSDRQIRIATSSLLGQMKHADSINFFRTYNMDSKRERLGDKISRRKSQCPFTGISHNAQRRFEALLYNPESGEPEENYEMELLDYEVIDSIKEFYDDGRPKPCLAIRFRWNGATVKTESSDGKERVIENGEEYYSYTGSKILIEQAQTEFSKEDLPAPTVIRVEINKNKKKFYKFT